MYPIILALSIETKSIVILAAAFVLFTILRKPKGDSPALKLSGTDYVVDRFRNFWAEKWGPIKVLKIVLVLTGTSFLLNGGETIWWVALAVVAAIVISRSSRYRTPGINRGGSANEPTAEKPAAEKLREFASQVADGLAGLAAQPVSPTPVAVTPVQPFVPPWKRDRWRNRQKRSWYARSAFSFIKIMVLVGAGFVGMEILSGKHKIQDLVVVDLGGDFPFESDDPFENSSLEPKNVTRPKVRRVKARQGNHGKTSVSTTTVEAPSQADHVVVQVEDKHNEEKSAQAASSISGQDDKHEMETANTDDVEAKAADVDEDDDVISISPNRLAREIFKRIDQTTRKTTRSSQSSAAKTRASGAAIKTIGRAQIIRIGDASKPGDSLDPVTLVSSDGSQTNLSLVREGASIDDVIAAESVGFESDVAGTLEDAEDLALDQVASFLSRYVRQLYSVRDRVDWNPSHVWIRQDLVKDTVAEQQTLAEGQQAFKAVLKLRPLSEVTEKVYDKYRTDRKSARSLQLAQGYAGAVLMLGGLSLILRIGTGRNPSVGT